MHSILDVMKLDFFYDGDSFNLPQHVWINDEGENPGEELSAWQ